MFVGCRLGRPEDENAIYEFLLPMHLENGLFPLSERRSRDTIRKCLGLDDGRGFVGIIDGKDGIEASIGILFTSMWYTDAIHLQELWMYVSPKHRATTHAKTLVQFGQHCSDRMSQGSEITVPFLFGMVTRRRLIPKMRLYQRSAPQVGALFLHPSVPGDVFGQRRGGRFADIKREPDAPFPDRVYAPPEPADAAE